MSSAGSVKSCTSAPLSGAIAVQNSRRALAASADRTQTPQRVVPTVVQRRDRGEACHLAEDVLQQFTVAVLWVSPEVLVAVAERRRPAWTLAREQRRVDQAVVLHEAHEHAGEDPGDRSLGDLALTPLFQRHRRPTGVRGLRMLGTQVLR